MQPAKGNALGRMQQDCAERGLTPAEYVYECRAEIARDLEEERRRVRKMVVLLAGVGLGTFVLENVIAATIARRFPEAYLVAGFRESPAYRGFVVGCNGRVDAALTVAGDAAATMLVDWFDVGMFAPVRGPPPWRERRLHTAGLVLLPGMLRIDAARLAGLGEAPPVFRLPPDREAALRRGLVGRGLDPDRWFACLHVRDDGPDDDPRHADAGSYAGLIRHLIEAVGGQVVRLGGPGAEPLPARDGLVDLAGVSDSFALQAAAIRFARFFIGTDAGPLTLASAFKVPSAGTNMAGYARRLWNRDDVVLAKPVRMADGSTCGTRQAYRQGYLDNPLPDGARRLDNSPEELLAVAGHMLRLSGDCLGWRPAAEEIEPVETGPFRIPLPMRDEPLVRFWA